MVQTKMAVKNLQEEIISSFGQRLANEIDGNVMSDALVASGWTLVKFTFNSNEQAIEITDWLNDTCDSKWARFNGDYLFKNKKDAEWFILKWS